MSRSRAAPTESGFCRPPHPCCTRIRLSLYTRDNALYWNLGQKSIVDAVESRPPYTCMAWRRPIGHPMDDRSRPTERPWLSVGHSLAPTESNRPRDSPRRWPVTTWAASEVPDDWRMSSHNHTRRADNRVSLLPLCSSLIPTERWFWNTGPCSPGQRLFQHSYTHFADVDHWVLLVLVNIPVREFSEHHSSNQRYQNTIGNSQLILL